jgi:hypothetical protein
MEASPKRRPPSGMKSSGPLKRHQTPPRSTPAATTSTSPSSFQIPGYPLLPPIGLPRTRSRSSSHDYDSPLEHYSNGHSHSRRTKQSRARLDSSSTEAPPPPPPPPNNNQYHIRADSSGSVSSLGSMGLGGGGGGSRDLNVEEYHQRPGDGPGPGHGHSRSDSIGSGFFDMIRQWSPQKKTNPSSSTPIVPDFYPRNNQAFLQPRSSKDRSISLSTPASQPPRHQR